MNAVNSIYTGLANNPLMKKAVRYCSQNNGQNLQQVKRYAPVGVSVWAAYLYMLTNMTSKNIPEERKSSMWLQDVAIGVFSASTGLLIDRMCNGLKAAMKNNIAQKITDTQSVVRLGKGVDTLVPLVATTIAFRFLAPVLAPNVVAPIVERISNKGILNEHLRHEQIEHEAENNSKKYKQEDVNKQLLENIATIAPVETKKVAINPELAVFIKNA